MTTEQFKKATKEQLKEYGKNIPLGFTKDKDGNVISYRDVYECWWERTVENGYETSFRDSNGDWLEWNYKDGNLISLRNSIGYHEINGKAVTKEEYEEFMNGLEQQ